MITETQPEFLTVEQAADYLAVPAATIYRILSLYGLDEATREAMGRHVRIRRTDLDAMDLTAADTETTITATA